jgi:hypothetical protein
MSTVREWPLPTPLTFGSRQPQSQKMTTRGGGGIVGVCRPCVEDVCYRDERQVISAAGEPVHEHLERITLHTICHELDVPDLEDHVQRQSLSGLFKHFDRLFLFFRQSRDQASLNVTSDRPNKVRVVVGQDLAVVEVEDLERVDTYEISSNRSIRRSRPIDRLTAFCTQPF